MKDLRNFIPPLKPNEMREEIVVRRIMILIGTALIAIGFYLTMNQEPIRWWAFLIVFGVFIEIIGLSR